MFLCVANRITTVRSLLGELGQLALQETVAGESPMLPLDINDTYEIRRIFS